MVESPRDSKVRSKESPTGSRACKEGKNIPFPPCFSHTTHWLSNSWITAFEGDVLRRYQGCAAPPFPHRTELSVAGRL